MEKCTYRIAAPTSVIAEIEALVTEHRGASSEPQPASSTADPLNAPISGGDLQAAAQVLTIVFTTGAAGAKFIEALLRLAKARKARIKASNIESKITKVLSTEDDAKDLMPKDK
ncbi:MAG TPA: hypothetical protein VHW09_15720 [Bryobacteraceae bacterium]|nr:hypothetical protein [Bryobacteraceae bacterium]